EPIRAQPVNADTLRAQPYIDWRAIIAGAILAAGVSFADGLRIGHRSCGLLDRAHLARLVAVAVAALRRVPDLRGALRLRHRRLRYRTDALAGTCRGQSGKRIPRRNARPLHVGLGDSAHRRARAFWSGDRGKVRA